MKTSPAGDSTLEREGKAWGSENPVLWEKKESSPDPSSRSRQRKDEGNARPSIKTIER